MIPGLPAFTPDSLRERIAELGRPLAVACYANSQARVATYLPLARAIARAGHASFLLLVPEINRGRNLLPQDLQGYTTIDGLVIGTLGMPEIPNVEGIDVFFSSEILGASPRGSRTVRIIHSLPDGNLGINYATRLRRHPHLARTTDYLAIPIRQTERAWSVDNYIGYLDGPSSPVEAGRRAQLDIVPAGYPKIEYLSEEIPANSSRRNLIFCPTATTVAHSRVRTHGTEILYKLLEKFPRHRVIFRPYPKGSEPDFADVIEAFRDEPRFIYDRTLSGLEYFREAAVAITDRSSAAVSFSIATGRPSVFFQDGGQASDVVDDPLGYRVSSVEQLVSSVRHAIARSRSWRKRILGERERYLYRPGEASDYLAQKIPTFASGGTDADWLSIPRDLLHS